MSEEPLLAVDFAAFERNHPIPADQRELARTLFYFGATCVIDIIRVLNSGGHTPSQAQAIFDSVCHEVADFSLQQMLASLFDGITVHVASVGSAPFGTH